MSKKKAWSDLLGTATPHMAGDARADDEGAKEPPTTVLMHTIVGNPENPRSEEDYTDEDPEFRELKASMREIGQLQPLAAVSRSVYEQAKPDAVAQTRPKARGQFREAEWVVITGNRRLAAARQLGWTRIDIRVHDQLGDEDGRIDEAVIIENIHRKNIAPIKEAVFLKRMVDKHGSQDKVAERIGKSQMYVSHRLALLKLAPDIQEQVDAGELKLKDARQLAGKTTDHAEQRARVAEIQQKAAAPKPARQTQTPPVQNPVLKTETAATPGVPGQQNTELGGHDGAPQDPGHEKTPLFSDSPRQVVRMPWTDGDQVADIVIAKMSETQREVLINRLIAARSVVPM